VLGDPARTPAQSAWVREVIGEVRRGVAPGRVRVVAERAPRVVRGRGRTISA
jgi:hypothetical protein